MKISFYISIFVLTLFVAFAIIGSFIPPLFSNLSQSLMPPSFKHIFGTDILGRDVFLMIIKSSSSSLTFSFIASFFSCFLGLFSCFLCVYFKAFESLINFFINIMFVTPSLLFIMLIQSLFKTNLIFLALIIGFCHFAEITRALLPHFKRLLNADFVNNFFLLGGNVFDLVLKEIFPLIFRFLSTLFVFYFLHSLLTESTLSFFGLGLENSLGKMLDISAKYMLSGAYHVLIFSSLYLIVLLFSLHGLLSKMKI